LTSRIVLTDPSGTVLSHSPDLADWLGLGPGPITDLLGHLLANLPPDIHSQAFPLDNGTTVHHLSRSKPSLVEHLQQENQMLRETLDAIDGPVVVYSGDLRYIFGNRAYHDFYPHLPPEAELVGKTYEQVLGISLSADTIVDPLAHIDQQGFIAARRAHMLDRSHSFSEQHNPKLGRWTTLRVKWTPSGNRVSLRVDITPLKRLQQELLDTQRMKTIGHISGGVAHNFNNLLTVITSNLEMLLEDARLPADSTQLARRALSSAEAGARLVRQLLSFAQRDLIQNRAIDPNTMLADMAELLRGAAGAAIALEIVPSGPIGFIHVDPAPFATAMMNLVLNARDAVQDGIAAGTTRHGRIRISASGISEGTQPMVALRVSDNGCGMSPEVAAAAFDPFFTTKGLATASGLGLSQVHGFATGAGGDVRIQSVPGSGTSVEIKLPMAQGERVGTTR
jgi:signal transduction histidine kinase